MRRENLTHAGVIFTAIHKPKLNPTTSTRVTADASDK